VNITAHLWRATPVEHELRCLAGSGLPEAIRVWLLGGFRFSVGSRAFEENRWRLKKAASLGKLLALAPYYKMHRERVTDLLWPDPDPEAVTITCTARLPYL
jgi:hypothetical protein